MNKISAISAVVTSALFGCALLLVGIFLLAGLGWALVAGGLSFLLIALALARGSDHGE